MATDHLPDFLSKVARSGESSRHEPPCAWIRVVTWVVMAILASNAILWPFLSATQSKVNQSREELVELKTSMKYIESGVTDIRQQLVILNAKLDQVRRKQQE